MRAVVRTPGPPDVIAFDESEAGSPGDGQLRVRHHAVAVNFIDTYHRSGLYPLEAPFGLGLEAAGAVEEVGPGVEGVSVGDRIAYVAGPPGAYADARLVPAARAVKLPEAIEFDVAASSFLRGMTAEYLLHRAVSVGDGVVIVIHAAAGGLGQIMSGWAKALGATVIGTVSTQDKAGIARAVGCHHVVVRNAESLADVVAEVTNGNGVDAVFDGVGGSVFDASLGLLRKRGTLVNYGNAEAPARAVSPGELNKAGSLFLTGASVMDYTASRVDLEMSAQRFFDAIAAGWIAPGAARSYALSDAAQAHADLESGTTSGAAILKP